MLKSKLMRNVGLVALLVGAATTTQAATFFIGDTSQRQSDGILGGEIRAGTVANGSGSIEVNGGSQIELRAGAGAQFDAGGLVIIGRRPGATATSRVTGAGSAIIVHGNSQAENGTKNSPSSVQIGREATGIMTIENGGRLELIDRDNVLDPTDSNTGEIIMVGRNGGHGTLNVDNGSVLINTNTGAFLQAGRSGGTGIINVDNDGSITVRNGQHGNGAHIALGRDANNQFDIDVPQPSDGTMNVNDGTVLVDGGQGFGGLFVGRSDNTRGALNIQGGDSSVSITAQNEAGAVVGREDGSEGTVSISNGGRLSIDGDDTFFTIGRDAGSTGSVEVLSGGRLAVDGTTDGDMIVGAAFDNDGGKGSLTVSGTGSRVDVMDNVIVGAPTAFGPGQSEGGNLVVSDGGVLRAGGAVFIGENGTLSGNGGTIDSNVVLDGGSIAPGASPGRLDILGDLNVLGGELVFEFAGTAPGQFDFLNIGGDLLASEPIDIVLSFIDGFVPVAQTSFDFLNIDGDDSAMQSINLIIQGLSPDAVFDIGSTDGQFTLTTINNGVAAVPLPAGLPLAFTGLLALGLLSRKRRAGS